MFFSNTLLVWPCVTAQQMTMLVLVTGTYFSQIKKTEMRNVPGLILYLLSIQTMVSPR